MKLTRRKLLLKGALTAGAGAALGPLLALARTHSADAASSSPEPKATPAVLYDMTRCVGCRLCEVACLTNKGLPPDKALLTFKNVDPSVSPDVGWLVRRQQCMHCLEPACVSVCPVGAMVKTPEGPVIYKDERCLGCRYCMNACPFQVPAFDWNAGILDGALIRKCDFCAARQAEGKQPACVEACPAKAVIFGDRAELLAEAKRRVQEQPDRYVDHVYGEFEAGGTSYLVLSKIPFEKLGMPIPENEPPQLVSEAIMKGMEWFIPSWLGVLAGVTAITKFRQRRMDELAGEHAKPGKEE